MIADPSNVFMSVRDGASVPGTDKIDNSAGAGHVANSLIVLGRIGEVHRRIFVKGGFHLVRISNVFVLLGVSFAPRSGEGCWRTG